MIDPTAAYAAFFATGAVPGIERPTVEDRLTFIRASFPDERFKKLAWPHFAAFVDASNVARANPPPIHKVNEPKARLEYLEIADAALRKLGYIPIFVSDGSLFHLIDQPYKFREKYGEYPHSIGKGRSADNIVLHALRRLPEAIVVTRDRYDKPDEVRDFADVLGDRSKFYRWRFNEDFSAIEFRQRETDAPLASARRRLAQRWMG